MPDVETIDDLLATTIRSEDDARLVRAGVDRTVTQHPVPLDAHGLLDIQAVYRYYSMGYSVVVNRIHRKSSPVAQLCGALEAALHHRVGANLYFTPRGRQGFLPHVDTHDVFILQLTGSKDWRVASAQYELPLPSDKPRPPEKLSGCHEYSLKRGDLLYIPRGFPHEATTTAASSSLHLTIGIHVFTWADFLEAAIGVLATEQVGLRRALPIGFIDTSFEPGMICELVDVLASALTSGVLTEQAKQQLARRLIARAKPGVSHQFSSIDATADLDENSMIFRDPSALCLVRTSPTEAVIEFASNYVSGPLRLEAPLIFIAEHERFSVGELPGGLSDAEKIALVTRLVSEGLLGVSNTEEVGS
ncbi:cupin domain-containing protein [Nocardia transvalensis]|uniref:cupin domain-containing protein n=1 Tax=Nocardia transvalensis TaxID=37333 RepID=UPI002B4B05F4|nr:cupin domain-containing protein [Nocardia transvalensis]